VFLTFAGAARTVTGSKYLVETGDQRILIDCGLFQGLKELRLKNWANLPIPAASLDAVVITHAHVDHSGYLPLLVRQGFSGKVYCTPATEKLCRILLPDSGRLQEEEANYANRKGFSKHHPALPLYSEKDAEQCLSRLSPMPYGLPFNLASSIDVLFRPSGHILGAATVELRAKNRTIVFSGDLGRYDDLLMSPPIPVPEADYLVVESTYGGRLHDSADPLKQLAEIINRTVDRKGVVLVPSFAVGRAQTLLYALYRLRSEKRIPKVPIFLNSPMAISATELLCEFCGDHRLSTQECSGSSEVATYVRTAEDSKKLNERSGPMIIIAASGMATGGRILHHLKAFGPDSKNTILFTGFQSAGTRGAALLAGSKEIKIHGAMVPIRAERCSLDSLSAHADQDDILKWLSEFKNPPRDTFITHGEVSQSEALQNAIRSKLGWKCQMPKYLERVKL